METLPYLEFCLAQTRHQQSINTLSESERSGVREAAIRQWQMEERILTTDLALTVKANPPAVRAALGDIRMRYPDQTAYLADLAANGLDEAVLQLALARELCVEAILAEVDRQTPPVTHAEAKAFYQAQPERFSVEEARQARHILITLNDDVAENRPDAVQTRMAEIATRLQQAPDSFAQEALQYSECPTAMQEGVLGWVKRGQLYPELETELFAMTAGEIRIAPSPLGLHLLWCEAIRPAGVQAFELVADKLLAGLQAQREKKIRMAWVKTLGASAVSTC